MLFSFTHSSAVVILTLSIINFSAAYVSHGEQCDQSQSATACDPYADLTCRNSVCECSNQADMEWNINRQKCVVLTGGSCYKSSGSIYTCVDEAYCQWGSDEGLRTCVCNYQMSPTSDRHCKKSHGATCEFVSECNTEDLITCSMGQCRCPQPLNHVFKEVRNRCFVKVGAPCIRNPAPGTVTCDPEENECLADLQSMTGYSCQCLAGNHMEHFARQCVKGNQVTCEDAAGKLLHPPCDVVAGLSCNSNKKCQCKLHPDQEWDEKQQACAVLEGRGCALVDPDEATWWFGFGQFFFQCFTGLECVALDGHNFEGICRKKA